MKSKLILILILIILYVSIYNNSIYYITNNLSGLLSKQVLLNSSEKFSEFDIKNIDSDKLNKLLSDYNNDIIITFDENYYYINIEDKSNIESISNKNIKNNKWLPKKFNIIKIALN